MQLVETGDQILEWFSDKPENWEAACAIRAVLRTIPFSADVRHEWLVKNSLLFFRSALIAWTRGRYPDVDTQNASRALMKKIIESQNENTSHNSYNINLNKINIMMPFYHMARQGDNENSQLSSLDSIAISTRIDKQLILYFNNDIQYLKSNFNFSQKIQSTFFCENLFLGSIPYHLDEKFQQFANVYLSIDNNYDIFVLWFHDRLTGKKFSFGRSKHWNEIEDKAILRRLAEATDKDFWGKGHEYVNAELTRWLDEARARVAQSPIIGDASGALEISGTVTGEMGPSPPEVPAKLPSQNTNAISFRTDSDGRIAINANALADHLRNDAGARDRHEEAVNEAHNALNRCQGNNAAARLTGLLTNYLSAAGENLEAAKPSLLVQRGERLRQELERYEAPDHMLPPVADDLLLDLKGWLTAHNMVVGLDPVLNAMDTAMLGPDRQPALIPPDEIREKAREAEEADLLQDGVIEVVEEAADLAPAVPNANDRHTIWSTEMVRNLMIETASVALNNPAATGTVVAVGALLSSGLAVGIAGGVSIMGSIKAAEYLVTHKEWVLARLGNSPTWQALITKLADWLEKMTPFEPK